MTKRSKGRVIFRAAFLFALFFGLAMGGIAIFHPDSPLPNGWNPTRPLQVSDAVTPLTGWKLQRSAGNRSQCLAALGSAAEMERVISVETRHPNCEVSAAVSLGRVGKSAVGLTETACATALRLAMWERHGVQPAAREFLNTDVSEIIDNGSYNCRRMRTTAGGSQRWSTHATAMAIDVSGFRLADGRTVRLLRDWDGDDATATFLRAVRDASCRWFATTLSPDYNALHADHFHLQATGWGTCR